MPRATRCAPGRHHHDAKPGWEARRTAAGGGLADAAAEDAGHDPVHPACGTRGQYSSAVQQGAQGRARWQPLPLHYRLDAGRQRRPLCLASSLCRRRSSASLTQRLDVALVAVPPDVAHRHHILAPCGARQKAEPAEQLPGLSAGGRGRPVGLPDGTGRPPPHDPRTQVCGVHGAGPARLAQPSPVAFLQSPAKKRGGKQRHDGLLAPRAAEARSLRAAAAGKAPPCKRAAASPPEAGPPPLERVPLEAVPAGDVHAVLHGLVLEEPGRRGHAAGEPEVRRRVRTRAIGDWSGREAARPLESSTPRITATRLP